MTHRSETEPPDEMVRYVADSLGIVSTTARLILREGSSPETLRVLSSLDELHEAGVDEDVLEALTRGFVRVAETVTKGHLRDTDPLEDVDDPLTPEEQAESLLYAELQAQLIRRYLLHESAPAAEAAKLAGYSRQNLEDHRRKGHVLGFRLGGTWHYPRWQFAPGGTRGVIPNLKEVVETLALSPVGAMVWIRSPNDRLDGQTPLDLLRAERSEPVLSLARELARMV
ncbi:MAG: antitoxin Xre/MbcA/ParS toxin-binding domain-containing protein [Gemmatimonadota bacterium]